MAYRLNGQCEWEHVRQWIQPSWLAAPHHRDFATLPYLSSINSTPKQRRGGIPGGGTSVITADRKTKVIIRKIATITKLISLCLTTTVNWIETLAWCCPPLVVRVTANVAVSRVSLFACKPSLNLKSFHLRPELPPAYLLLPLLPTPSIPNPPLPPVLTTFWLNTVSLFPVQYCCRPLLYPVVATCGRFVHSFTRYGSCGTLIALTPPFSTRNFTAAYGEKDTCSFRR